MISRRNKLIDGAFPRRTSPPNGMARPEALRRACGTSTPFDDSRRATRSPRAGFTLLELFVATVLFGAVLTTFLPLMKSVGQTQRATDRQNIALREVNNVLEQIAPRPWSELTQESLSEIKLSETAQSFLPQASLQIDLAEQSDPVPAKRIAVRLSWLPQPSRPAESVRLSAWFPKREVQP